jgi:hypothetical protein
VLAGSLALGAARHACGQVPNLQEERRQAKPFLPSEGLKKPMGVGKGIHPGRVVWVHNPEVARWDGVVEGMTVKSATGEWWDDANCDPVLVERMVSTALQGLTGKSSDKQAWDALFRHFNQTRKLGDSGYKPGEKIAIKFNFNNDRPDKEGWRWPSGRGMPSPQVIHSVLRQLVEVAGVPGRDITIYDVADGRYISDPVYLRVRSGKDREYQDINFMVNPRTAGIGKGRLPAVPDKTCPIRFSRPEVGMANVPVAVVEAKYRINCALIRPHLRAGVTLTTKNNFGSIYWLDAGPREMPADSGKKDYWRPRPVHQFVTKTHPMGSYSVFVDLMGFKHLGGKDMLVMLDALYSAEECETNIMRFQSFGDHWTASLVMPQDPVAIDSVGLDFLRNEPKAKNVAGNPDNFLHEAALADHPPSGIVYDPKQDGTRLASLGVHEHWNNGTDKKYSRNLGKSEGIELLALSAKKAWGLAGPISIEEFSHAAPQ